MENNNQEQLREEEIPNIEQFQVGRNPSPEEEAGQSEGGGGSGMRNAVNPDAEYTDREVQFADGQGSQLNQQAGGPEEDDDDDDDDIVIDDPDDDEINVDDPDEDLI